MHSLRLSTYLIFLAAFLLGIGLVMAVFIYITVENLKNDAEIINHAGIIRGMIQRITKLHLSDPSQSCELLIKETDQMTESFLCAESIRTRKSEFTENIRNLKEKWENLKENLAQYRVHPCERIRRQITAESEICWQIADSAVLTAQIATEGKIRQIRLFYLVLSLHAVNTLAIIWFVYAFVRKKLEYHAWHDPMTGLFNRRSYENTVEKELARCKRYGSTLSLILFDIDYFKRVNDTYGHKTGDSVLIQMACTVRESVRKTDSVFRVGGEEFAIIMPEAGGKEAAVLAEKIRACVESRSFGPVKKITVSLGIAESDGTASHSDVYRQADAALYRAKKKGRNKVELFKKI